MGAFQCLVCPTGGVLEGIRGEAHGRIRREFGTFKSLCIGRYDYEDGEQFVFFTLDSKAWPDEEGHWGVKSNSWNAECNDEG